MNSSYSTLVIWMYVRPTMIVVSIWIDAVDFRRGHDFDQAIDVPVSRADLSMHCPDSNYHDVHAVHLRHRQDSRLAVSHVDFRHRPAASKTHRMQLLVAAIVAIAVVPG